MIERTITPSEPEPEKVLVTNDGIPQELMDEGITLKNLEFLDYLNLKDSMFNSDLMAKVTELSEYFENIDTLTNLDLQLGQPPNITKLDKLYTYMLLLKQEDDVKEKQDLIDSAKSQFIN